MNPKTNTPPPPFSCTYNPQLPELLHQLGCSIAITTYQAGKLIFLSPKDENGLVQLTRNFNKPMGIAENIEKDQLAIACKNEITLFSNSKQLAKHYPNAPSKYDALYMPRLTYHTGALDIHDLRIGKDERIFAVNTLFSTISEITKDYNFQPYWIPPFIDKIVSEDRCHLNGMAMQNGLPKYASAFNKGNSFQSWREHVTTSGIIMDVDSNELIIENLGMPHSPRLYHGELYVLLSATGELVKIDIQKGTYDVVVKIEGFVRGMSLQGDYMFIGLSKLRKNSSTFAKLKIAERANRSGIVVVHLHTGAIVGQLTYMASVDEIYDVHILADKVRPNILNTMNDDHYRGLMTPHSTYWARGNNEK